MFSESGGSELAPARQARRPLTSGFLPGLSHRYQSSSSQGHPHLLDSKPHIHFVAASRISRIGKTSGLFYSNDEDTEEDELQDENYRIRHPSFRHYQQTNFPSTSSKTSRVGLLRRRPAYCNLRESASVNVTDPAVVVDSVALKVRQFTATARSTSGLCCVGYSNRLPAPLEPQSDQCISADGATSPRGKHTRRKQPISSSTNLAKSRTSSTETLKPHRVYTPNNVTASPEEARRNSKTDATASELSSGVIASASGSGSSKPRPPRAKAPSSNKKSKGQIKDREKLKSKPSEDYGTAPPTSSSSSRTRTSATSNASKRLLSSSTRQHPSGPRTSPTSPGDLNVGHDFAPATLTRRTGTGLPSHHTLIQSSGPTSTLPLPDFFSTSSPDDFVFPSFDALDDLIRWDMDSIPDIPGSPQHAGTELEGTDPLRHAHQNLSDVASSSRSPSSASPSNPDPAYFNVHTANAIPSHTSASVSPSSRPSSSPSSRVSTLFSTPFDDEPIEYESPFPSVRRAVLMEDSRVQKSKTRARNLSNLPNLAGFTTTLMQRPRRGSPSDTSPSSESSLPSTSTSTSTKSPVTRTASRTTPPSSPLPPLPHMNQPPSSNRSHPLAPQRSEPRPSLPTGLPSPLLPPNPAQLLGSRSSTPVQTESSSSPASSRESTRAQPHGQDVDHNTHTQRRSPPVPIPELPRHPPASLSIPASASAASVSLTHTLSTSPTTNSASDSGYGSSSTSRLIVHGRKRSSPRSSDQEKAKKKGSPDEDREQGRAVRTDGKGWGGTTKTWTDPNGCVHLGAEDCNLEIIFPQFKDFEVWDMGDNGWVAVPVLLYLMAKDASRWTGAPLAMPDVTHIDLQCDDSPIPVPFDGLGFGTTLSASSSTFHTNAYTTSFQGGKSALDDSSSFGAGKGFRSGSSSRPGRGMSMMEALRKKEEEQTMKADKISIEGRWVRTHNRPGVDGARSRASDDFRAEATDEDSSRSRSSSPGSGHSHSREGGKRNNVIHRGWYLKLWVPIPTRLFVKRETRIFKLRGRVWLMGDEEKEERGLRRGDTLLDKFEIGMEEVEKWLGKGDEEEQDDAEPLVAETEMTVSHLRREREMDSPR